MHPRDYPWAVPTRTGVVGPEGFAPHTLPALPAPAGRTPVVAVGSNASPDVLVGKFGGLLRTGVPIPSAVVTDLVIGHSAHVSARGYIAAAPAPAQGAVTAVGVTWCDEAQLARLDETEPNYRRLTLPTRMPCHLEDGTVVTQAQLYVSAHGLLADEGEVLPLCPQAEVLAWLAERLPGLAADLTHVRLVDHGLRERVRLALIEKGLVTGPW